MLPIDKEIAYGRFARDHGMVVDIRKYLCSTYLFNCQFWSDYTDENERFFLGSLQQFYFKSIHNVSTKEDYEPFIRIIDILQQMIDGYPYQYGHISTEDVSCLDVLINNRVNTDIIVPHYINKFFNNFCNQVEEIKINMDLMNCHDKYAETDQYGFLKLKELFCDSKVIQLIKFAKLFKNTINTIIIFNDDKFVPSIELNKGFEVELTKLMAFINSSKVFKNRFKFVIIVNPKIDDLDAFIISKKDFFIKKYGWMLEKRQYYDIKRNSKGDKSVYYFPIV